MARASETAQRLMKLEGVGALTAAAIVAAAGYGKQFANGRQFAAWLGLVPREYSSGREVRRGRISKRGDAHLRTLLIHGVRVIYRYLGEKSPRITPDIKLMPDATEYMCAQVRKKGSEKMYFGAFYDPMADPDDAWWRVRGHGVIRYSRTRSSFRKWVAQEMHGS